MRSPCDPCGRGAHVQCWSVLSDHSDDACGCYDADPERHETEDAYQFAMYGEQPEEW